ncbi:MAG TPA: hypothetical protein VGE72_17075 [Azospirillum sp.]
MLIQHQRTQRVPVERLVVRLLNGTDTVELLGDEGAGRHYHLGGAGAPRAGTDKRLAAAPVHLSVFPDDIEQNLAAGWSRTVGTQGGGHPVAEQPLGRARLGNAVIIRLFVLSLELSFSAGIDRRGFGHRCREPDTTVCRHVMGDLEEFFQRQRLARRTGAQCKHRHRVPPPVAHAKLYPRLHRLGRESSGIGEQADQCGQPAPSRLESALLSAHDSVFHPVRLECVHNLPPSTFEQPHSGVQDIADTAILLKDAGRPTYAGFANVQRQCPWAPVRFRTGAYRLTGNHGGLLSALGKSMGQKI